MARQTGQRPPGLDGPPLPRQLAYIWGWYEELARWRPKGDWGPVDIDLRTIENWARLTGRHPTGWEIDCIKAIDDVFLAQVAKNREAADQQRRGRHG